MKVKDSNDPNVLTYMSEGLTRTNNDNVNNSKVNLKSTACVDRNNPNFRGPQRVVKRQKRSMAETLKIMGLGALGGTAIALTLATGTVFAISRVQAYIDLQQYGKPVRTTFVDARTGFTNKYYLVDGQEVLKDDLLDDLTMENFREIVNISQERGK